MKVLLVTFSNNSDHQDTLFGLYEELLNTENIEPYLLTVKNPKVPLEISDHTWLVDAPERPGIERKTFDFFTLHQIIKKIKRNGFDAVYFESLHVWNVAIMLSIDKKTHRYQVIHEVIPHEGDKQEKGVDFMNKVVCKISDTIVLRNKKYIHKMVNTYSINQNRVKYMELWRRYPAFSRPAHNGHVLFFGRINPYKGIDNLLKIVKLCPEIKFDVIGRIDPQIKYLVDELSKEPNVNLNNEYVSDLDMKDAFLNCDWVIVPYNSASQSGIIIDAYKYSRPVIAFDVGALKEQIDDGKSGFLIESGNIELFAKKLKDTSKMPKEEYEYMCKYAYEYGSEKYSAKFAAERFLSLIEGDKANDNN